MSMARKLSLVALAALGIVMSSTASADGRGHGHRHGHKHWHGPYAGAYYYPAPAYVVRERVVVQRPVYVAPPPAYYYAPPPRYPGVVVHVDVPPIVFPLR